MGKKNKSKKNKQDKGASVIDYSWDLTEKNENIILGLFLLFVMVIFHLTMPPAMIGGDSGEFSAIACAGGIPHPPGYPLYAMLSHGFNLVFPFGSESWKPNFLSSIFAIVSIFLLYKSVRKSGGSLWAGLTTGGLFAFSSLIWRYSNTAEVFALNNLFVSILIYLYMIYEKGNKKHAYAGAFIIGLGLTNHHTFLFFGVPIVGFIIYEDFDNYKDIKTWLFLVVSGLVGLLPYSYLYFESLAAPELSWGDQTTWDGFFTHLLRKEFGTFKLNPKTSNADSAFFVQIFSFIKIMIKDFAFIGLPLFIYGLQKAKENIRLKGIVAASAFYMFIFSIMSQMEVNSELNLEVLSRFWQQTIIPLFVLVGLGLEKAIQKWKWPKWTIPSLGSAMIVILILLNFNEMNFSKNNVFPIFGKSLLRPLEEDSVFMVHRDVAIFSSRYVQKCLGFRKDIDILVREQMKTDWYQRVVKSNFSDIKLPSVRLRDNVGPKNYNLKQFFEANIDKKTIYITNFGNLLTDKSWEKDFVLAPWGMVNKVYRKKDFNFDQYIAEALKTLPSFDEVKNLQKYIEHPWEQFTWPIYWNAFYNIVESISIRGQQFQRKEYLEKAIEIYHKMNEVFVDKPDGFWKVLGVTYQRMAVFDNRYEKMKIQAFKKYLETNPIKDNQVPIIKKLIQAYESKAKK